MALHREGIRFRRGSILDRRTRSLTKPAGVKCWGLYTSNICVPRIFLAPAGVKIKKGDEKMERIRNVIGRLAEKLAGLATLVGLWIATALWFCYPMRLIWEALVTSTAIGSALGYLILLGLGITMSFFIVLFVGASSHDIIEEMRK